MAHLHWQCALAATVISILLFAINAQNIASFAQLVLTTYRIQGTTGVEGHFQEVAEDSFHIIKTAFS